MMDAANLLGPVKEILPYLYAELILGITMLAVTVTSLVRKPVYPWPHYVGITGIFCSILVSGMGASSAETTWFSIDEASFYWKLVLDGCMAVILLFNTNRHLRMRSAEYVLLALMILFGAHFLIISRHLFLVYLSIEVMSLSAYMLVALPLFKRQVNSAFKYLAFGATSSAIMLYGISLFYGIQGSLTLAGFDPALDAWQSPLGWTVLVLISAGILFKIAAVPFHIWVKDVYSETSLPVLAIFSIVPKLSALLFLIRWMPEIPNSEYLIALLAVITIATGNFGALRQSGIRGMMGFSAIAHTGFMLSGLLMEAGNMVFLQFYMTIYAIMTLGAFHALNYYELTYGAEKITDLAGTSVSSSWRTIGMVVWMIALTGIPPTAGFTAKLLLFSGMAQQYAASENSIILYVLIFAVINAVVSLAYYLRIPYQMIFRKPEVPFGRSKKIWTAENFLSTILVLTIIILFIKPEWLMGWINNVSFAQ
jgi:NADH-quinone oxidoreductase subunit N